jgi:hypothetical protein
MRIESDIPDHQKAIVGSELITIYGHRVYVKFSEHCEHTNDLSVIQKAWNFCNSSGFCLLEKSADITRMGFPVWIAKDFISTYMCRMREMGIY